MQGTSIWLLMAAVGPWLYERRARKFYERMKRRDQYEN